MTVLLLLKHHPRPQRPHPLLTQSLHCNFRHHPCLHHPCLHHRPHPQVHHHHFHHLRIYYHPIHRRTHCHRRCSALPTFATSFAEPLRLIWKNAKIQLDTTERKFITSWQSTSFMIKRLLRPTQTTRTYWST